MNQSMRPSNGLPYGSGHGEIQEQAL